MQKINLQKKKKLFARILLNYLVSFANLVKKKKNKINLKEGVAGRLLSLQNFCKILNNMYFP